MWRAAHTPSITPVTSKLWSSTGALTKIARGAIRERIPGEIEGHGGRLLAIPFGDARWHGRPDRWRLRAAVRRLTQPDQLVVPAGLPDGEVTSRCGREPRATTAGLARRSARCRFACAVFIPHCSHRPLAKVRWRQFWWTAHPSSPPPPARAGDIVLLFETGFGPATQPLDDGEPPQSANPLAGTAGAFIGGLELTAKAILICGTHPGLPEGLAPGLRPVRLCIAGHCS